LENNNFYDDRAETFENIKVIDDLLKANGSLLSTCLKTYHNGNSSDYYNECYISLDQFYVFTIRSDDTHFEEFRFVIDDSTISCFHYNLSVQVKFSNEQDEMDNRIKEIENFKSLFLNLINLKAKQKFDTISEFIDIYNMANI
jgi:hypothetical protein